MKLPITKLAELYFVLKDLETKPFENYSTSYRVFRNLEMLRPFGERYMKEMQEEAQKMQSNITEENQEILAAQANALIFQKWATAGEAEEIALKTLDLSSEKLPLTPAQLGVLFPILENIDDL